MYEERDMSILVGETIDDIAPLRGNAVFFTTASGNKYVLSYSVHGDEHPLRLYKHEPEVVYETYNSWK